MACAVGVGMGAPMGLRMMVALVVDVCGSESRTAGDTLEPYSRPPKASCLGGPPASPVEGRGDFMRCHEMLRTKKNRQKKVPKKVPYV